MDSGFLDSNFSQLKSFTGFELRGLVMYWTQHGTQGDQWLGVEDSEGLSVVKLVPETSWEHLDFTPQERKQFLLDNGWLAVSLHNAIDLAHSVGVLIPFDYD